jgi:hypothetical protein
MFSRKEERKKNMRRLTRKVCLKQRTPHSPNQALKKIKNKQTKVKRFLIAKHVA